MRKIFKLLLCFVLFFSGIIFVSCGEKEETPEERRLRLYDYNENEVIDDWEEPFEAPSYVGTTQSRSGYQTVEIKNIDDFKAMMASDEKSDKIYKLVSDLDFREENPEDFKGVIDLNGAYFYGNGKTLTCYQPYKLDKNGNFASEFIFFKNAKGIYDLTIYLGEIKGSDRASTEYSIFKDIEEIDNVRVKGRLELNVGSGSFDVSGLVTGNFKTVSNCLVDCELDILNPDNLPSNDFKVNFGGISIINPYGSEIKKSVTNIDVLGIFNSSSTLGGITAVNNGFIEASNSDFDLEYTTYENNKTEIGGISGLLGFSGEIKNCFADVDFKVLNNEKDSILYGDVAVGGIAGASYGSLFYNESLGNIEVKNINNINVGGFVGASRDSYILRNISKVNISVGRAVKMFVTNFVGSAMGGIIESCIAIGNVEATLDYVTEDITAKNIGLFLFVSNNYLRGELEDEFLTLNTTDLVIAPKNSPSLYKNLIRGNTTINSVQDGEQEETEEIINSMVNYGGYWWWIKRNGESQPRLFLESNCNSATITINGTNRTNSFFLDQEHATIWLNSLRVEIATNLKDYGLLSTEINSATATSFEELKFYNPSSQEGSFYQNEDQLVKDTAYCEGDQYFDHRVDTLYELKSISKYYKDSNKKRHLTFTVDSKMVSDNFGETFDSFIASEYYAKTYGEVVGEDVNLQYFLYSQAVRDTILEEIEEKDINDIIGAMEDLAVGNVEKIMLCVITEIANNKVQIYTDENNSGFINLSYKVANEETIRFYAIDAKNEGDFYRITLFF